MLFFPNWEMHNLALKMFLCLCCSETHFKDRPIRKRIWSTTSILLASVAFNFSAFLSFSLVCYLWTKSCIKWYYLLIQVNALYMGNGYLYFSLFLGFYWFFQFFICKIKVKRNISSKTLNWSYCIMVLIGNSLLIVRTLHLVCVIFSEESNFANYYNWMDCKI